MPVSVREVALLFLRLGLTAFGGPAAHIAMMRDEAVRRRRWLSDGEFLDLIGLVNLIPGPNSSELAMHIGKRRAGWPGFFAAGLGFVVPAVIIVLALAWGYRRIGTSPQVISVLAGIKPVVIALIAHALWALAPKAIRGRAAAVVGAAALGFGLAGANELLLMLGGGLALAFWSRIRGGAASVGAVVGLPLAGAGAGAAAAAAGAAGAPFSLATLFLVFLKIGAVMYGSGYVLFAFLQGDLVTRLGWLTDQQLLDAIAIGQVTPGPLFASATFIGYQLGGDAGALLATVGIFLPSFLFVALSGPLLRRLRSEPALGAFLDGVNVAALALMAAVAWRLGRASLVDAPAIAVGLLALALLARTRVASLWLIAGGAVFGWVRLLTG